ncbi:hypothetical protein VTO42DRAFT_9029 [Malbranchea cinnamomea]
MEDTNPQATRKRPRLDSGNSSHERMSLSPHDSSSGCEEDQVVGKAPPVTTSPAATPSVPSSLQRPSSRITISMRSPNSSDGPAVPSTQELPTNNFSDFQAPATTTTESAEPSEEPPQYSSVISVTSSPAQSVQIEVAEVEDMDQDPRTSQWRPLGEAFRSQGQAAPAAGLVEVHENLSLAELFPRLREDLDSREALDDVRRLLEKGSPHSHDVRIFLAVTAWLEQCVSHSDQLTYKSFTEDRDFWEELPCIVEGLLRREIDFQPDAGQGPWNCLESFILAFAQLALHLISVDVQTLRLELDAQSDPPDLISKGYWIPLSWILKFDGIPFYRTLEKIHGSEPINMVSRINDRISQPPVDSLRLISEFVTLILASVSTWPVLGPCFTCALQVINSMVHSALERRRFVADSSLTDSPVPTHTLRQAYDILRPMDKVFQSLLSKKPGWITSDTSDIFLRTIGGSYHVMAISSHQFGRDIAQDLGIELPESATPEEHAHIVHYGWRFIVLKRQITDGRMELRVQGVETMQTDLVFIYNQFIRGNPPGVDGPVPQYFVKYIRDNKLLDYLVGVDSHPQLISRSGNIIGFLVATFTYRNEDSDVIWKAVTESHDPRFVAEIMALLVRITALMTAPEDILYLCTKLVELPLNRFDQRMIEYFDQLLNTYKDKHERCRFEAQEYPNVDVIPVRLCVRLIREVRSEAGLTTEQKTQLQQVAGKQLSQLFALGITDQDKNELFQSCTEDIAKMNEFAVGSIHALLSLTSPYDGKDVTQLALEFDLTRLIIDELAHTVNSATAEVAKSSLKPELVPRIQLLLRIADKVPDKISSESSELLWDSLFMAEKLQDGSRSLAWEMLSKSLAQCARRNSFLERFMNDFLPRVPPEKFTPEILTFAEQAVSYELRFDRIPRYEENEVITIPGMERIWRIILTAPPGTVEMKAINFAIDVYLDDNSIRNAPRSAAEATHVALVDRCVEQLKIAASKLKGSYDSTSSGEDESMVILPSTAEICLEELRFSRSLLFLRQLLHGLRIRPQYTPPQGSPPHLILREDEVKGDPIELSYQAFSDSSNTPIRKLQIGDLSTLSELVDRLTTLTGFSKFSAFSAGRRLDLVGNATQTLRDLKLGSGLLMLRKHPDAVEMPVGRRRQSLTLVDSEVLKHFDDLYGLLSLDEKLSKEIFDFLVVFPPQKRVRDFVRSPTTSMAEIFPLDKPYKLLYSINCLTTCLREESLEASPNSEFITRSILRLVDFLTQAEMEVPLEADCLKLAFASNAVECLLTALMAKPLRDDTEELIPNPSNLITRLLSIIYLGQKVSPDMLPEQTLQKMISNSFAVVIEASLHDNRVWDSLKKSAQVGDIISELLLKESRQGIRKEVAEIIFKLCGGSPSQKQSKAINSSTEKLSNPIGIDIVATLWRSFLSLFPKTLNYPTSSEEFFEVSLVIFQTVVDLSPDGFEFGDYLKEWGSILLRHKTEEFVGREPVDYIVWGFAHLMKTCLSLATSKSVADDTRNLVERLFTTYLFPNLSELKVSEPIQPSIPVMHPGTRQELYNVLLLLSENRVNCEQLLELLEEIIPHDYTYDANWVFDRYKTIRSPEGYAGLRNLSNTCYLNSLFTQLFMNVDFRKFMLEVDASGSNQALLAETKKVFAYMQDTWQKCVDPSGVVDSIRTYDNEPIDINIQMDVDEFFNLLFDRWEAQISSAEAKKVFRSFYGGQLVQQIKSKECEHISERMEPFSAIQCDIKGKSDLEDSLRAYVEGEVMQGDNKYSCTSCGRHVDAVKRACLKEIPDNLIFHLKRFDFDVISMVRSKINDEFRFPERIDMTPYTVEHLSDPSAPIEPDMFELVGVLVHSGTAESGHYYSYVKERPSADSTSTWVEFNDSDVSRFDPAKIPDQCFGGQNDPLHGPGLGSVRYNKVWSAYMLFYQRVSHMEKVKSIYQPSPNGIPVHVPLPLELGNHIALENELFIRTFCLLDPYHAYFARGLLEQSRRIAASGETGAAKLQKLAISVALDNLDQLISRSKELPELEKLLLDFDKAMNENSDAALWILQWAVKRPMGIRNLLLRSPNHVVRNGFCQLMLKAFVCLRRRMADESLSTEDVAQCRSQFSSILENVLSTLKYLWSTMHLHARAWDNYFELILGIANLGTFELELLLDNEFFLRCLEMVWLDRDDLKKLKRFYPAYYRLVEKGRKFSHYRLMEVLYFFLTNIDLNLSPISDDQARIAVDGKFCMTVLEANLVLSVGRSKELLLLKKILEQQSNPIVSRRILTHFIDLSDSTPGLADSITKALEEGLRTDPASLSIPFLDATLVYCQTCPDEGRVIGIVDYTAKGVESINESGGREHLAFFQNLVTIRNDKIQRDDFWFWSLVVERIPDWAPTLLHYPDRFVRSATVEFLQQLLFSKAMEETTEDFREFYRKVGRELGQACVDRLQRVYVSPPGGQVNVDSRVVGTITSVINYTIENYYDGTGENQEDMEFIQGAAAVLTALEQLTVDIPEELVSESEFPSDVWEDHSVIGSDSDVGLVGSP